MTQDKNRRIFPRKPFAVAIYAYENGVRFTCEPVDCSVGGAFLTVSDLAPFQLGKVISVAFGQEAGCALPVYLFGIIARAQDFPQRGIALRWTKAVTKDKPEALARFMAELFDLQPDVVRKRMSEGRGGFRSLFSFEPIQRALDRITSEGAGEAPAPLADGVASMSTPIGVSTTIAEMRELDVRVVSSDQLHNDSLDEVPDWDAAHDREATHASRVKPPASDGTLTQDLSAYRIRVRLQLRALMDIDNKAFEVVVRELGLHTMCIETRIAPVDDTGEMMITFAVPTRSGSRALSCHCEIIRRVTSSPEHEAGLELAIREVDEGGARGLELADLKWLFFNDMAATVDAAK